VRVATTILLVEDEATLRASLDKFLMRAGYRVIGAADGESALKIFAERAVELALVDLKLPGVDGLAVLREFKAQEPSVAVIMMTACADIAPAVEAVKLGAYDYLKKPFDIREVSHVIENALRVSALGRELSRLEAGESKRYRYLVTSSERMRRVFQLVDRVSRTPHTPALVVGETGTGKEIVAREIHGRSERAQRRFVAVNCSALTETLLESELFGHVRGAFTDAHKEKAGLFEAAHGGTLFLDEISDLKPSSQPKLLRALEERTIRRVGGVEDIAVDVRVVAATNRDLAALVRTGQFREDLLYRLNVMTIDVPPLRERREDILALVEYYLAAFNAEFKKNIRGITEEAARSFTAYDWPGNVRELRNVIERAVILTEGPEVVAEPALFPASPDDVSGGVEELSLDALQRRHILAVLKRMDGNRTQAAAALGIGRTKLWAKLKEYGAA
jgi:DNA-binding NtrC family response regulator